ncbi:MAG: sulfatase [Planctomycetota bacterium]
MRTPIRVILLLMCVASASVRGAEKAEVASRPNLVFIIADDCTFRDLGCYGGQAATPNMDRLADQGMKFTKCFQTAPMCSPTRHNLYTGLYPVKSGAWPNHTFVYDHVKSVVQYLRPLGYRLALSGKTHVSPKSVFDFEYSAVKNNPDMDAIERLMTESAASDQPFCLFACSNEPHSPWNKGDASRYPPADVRLPPYLVDTPVVRESFSRYLAEITYYDDQVGQILSALDRHDLADNTLVMVVSEQGNSFPFAKWTCYDNGLQSGMLVRWPGKVKAATVTDAMVEYVDVLPTFVQAAGGSPDPVLDGKSFLPVLVGQTNEHKQVTFGLMTTRGIIAGSEAYPIRSVRSHQYRLILNLNHEATFTNAVTVSPLFQSMKDLGRTDARSAELVALYQKRPEIELYDVVKDPLNMDNLAGDPQYAGVVASLRDQLEAWMQSQGDQGMATEMAANERQHRGRKKSKSKRAKE